MKLIDEKGRLFGKLNIFDLLIILLLLVGVVGMASRLMMPAEKGNETKTATYQVEINNVDECYTTAFEVGDPIYEAGVRIGTVTAVNVRPAEMTRMMPDGSVKVVERAMYYAIDLTFTTDQFQLDEGFHVDTREMLAGTSHIISNGFATATAVIRTVEIAD